MAQCTRPITAYKGDNPDGGKRVVFNRAKSDFGLAPLQLRCGRCIGCRLTKAQDWATRCVHEATEHERNCFVTFTYDQEHMPSDRCVSKDELQKLFKRMRKHGRKFRYFAVGEYGRKTWRCHYHAIIFGHDFKDSGYDFFRKGGYVGYHSRELDERWEHRGEVIVNLMSHSAAKYCARYSLKKIGGERAAAHYRRTIDGKEYDLEPEFFLYSQNLGIRWLERYWRDCFPSDFLVIDGKKVRVPDAYLRKAMALDLISEEEGQAIKDRRQEKGRLMDRAGSTIRTSPTSTRADDIRDEAREKTLDGYIGGTARG